MGDFQTTLSDIDFVVTTKEKLAEDQVKTLQSMHISIEREVLQPNLNGIYILVDDLGKAPKEISGITYFHEGELRMLGAFQELPDNL